MPSGHFEFAVVSVPDREVYAAPALAVPSFVSRVLEALVWGESTWGGGLWIGSFESDCLERVLHFISDGSFPQRNHRHALTNGEKRQLRDAMILCAHVRAAETFS